MSGHMADFSSMQFTVFSNQLEENRHRLVKPMTFNGDGPTSREISNLVENINDVPALLALSQRLFEQSRHDNLAASNIAFILTAKASSIIFPRAQQGPLYRFLRIFL